MCRIFRTGTFPKVQRVLLEEITDSISGRLLRPDHKRDHGTVRRIQDSEQGKRGDQLGGRIFISKAVILLCTQPHSRDADVLSNFVYDRKRGLTDDQINAYMEEARNENIPIPDYAYDVHTRQGKMKGKTKADFFIEEDQSLAYRQLSLFDDINIGVM